LGDKSPSAGCASFLSTSAKATLQWRLEADYQRFERAALAQMP
jgi:hypothetical protein